MSNPECLLVQVNDPHLLEISTVSPKKPGDAGIDLYFSSPDGEQQCIKPGESAMVPSGINVKIPDGMFGLITARSSTFHNLGLMVVQGIIDSGYVGPLFTNVYHPGLVMDEQYPKPIYISPYDRLSQLILIPAGVHNLNARIVDSLPTTERGINGFGSTGN